MGGRIATRVYVIIVRTEIKREWGMSSVVASVEDWYASSTLILFDRAK
jgi:hypothetical protein